MNDNYNPSFVDWIRQASPYINAHRRKTFVLALGGEAIVGSEFDAIVQDISLLKSLGVRIVLVYGIRPQLDASLDRDEVHSTYTLNNLRVTSAEMVQTFSGVCGKVGNQLLAAFSSGLPDSPMHGSSISAAVCNAVTARPIGVLDGIDYQHTGAVRKVNATVLNNLLEQDMLALLPPLGYSATGEIFNLEYLDLAEKVALALRADKLVIYSKHSGIIDEDSYCIREISPQDCDKLKPISNTQRKIIEVAKNACNNGIKRTHVIGHKENGSLLKELLTRDGCGSLISAESFDVLRPATIDDIPGIMALIRPLEVKGTLVKRERELLEAEIDRFEVITRDNSVVACAALYYFDKGKSAELACIVSHPNYSGQGLGERLLKSAEKKARELDAESLFVLTTQTTHWFLEQGFKHSSVDALPDDKKQLYNYQRASKVLQKRL